ncbi:MAG TPA: hypothetical protein VMB50_17185, partial [Myxococcales bacterium]|nr:hypothetical protein [Myxococcales bacterium]
MPRYVPWCAAAALMLAGPSCEKQPAEAPAAPPVAAKPPAPAPQAPPGPARQHVAGIGFTVPKGWSLGAPRPMRFATFEVPKAAGDQEPADCGVYYFGPGEGGNVEANLARWLGQFKGPPAKFDRLDKRTIGGIQVTEVEQAGTFLWS